MQPTFDVVVPETHSFLANGVLSHNTTVALHVIAEAQKAGGIAAFIDAEHALDPTYARALGRRHQRDAGVPARHRASRRSRSPTC